MLKASMNRVAALARKEVLEFLRDRRTLILMALSAFLFPLLGLMVVGFKSQQESLVAILVCDRGPAAGELAGLIAGKLNETPGYRVRVYWSPQICGPVPGSTLTVVIPSGFSSNASRLDAPLTVRVYSLVGSAAGRDAESLVWSVVWSYSQKLARERVEKLAGMAGVEVNPDYILYPVRLVSEAVTATGAPAAPSLVEAAEAARFLAFSVFFVLNPAALAVADAVAREREMGTGELIAASPVTGLEFIAGKTAGAIAVASAAAALDLAAATVYLGLTGLAGGAALAAFHALQVILAVMVTAGLTSLITLLVPGRRAATLVASTVTGVATIVFFASLFIDFNSLPTYLQAVLYIIPYTHTVEAILSYALGNTGRALLHTTVLAAIAAAATALAARAYNGERLVKRY